MDQDFVDKIIAAKGDAGKKLLDRIPEIIEKYQDSWSIKILPPFTLSYNYVAPAVSADGIHMVFKIGLHGNNEFVSEHDALKVFDGDSIIRLLKSNIDDKVMLLERVEPGIPLSEHDDDIYATHAIASIIKKLPKPVPAAGDFVTLQDWFDGFKRLRKKFNGTTGPMPEKIIREGEELYQYLINTSTEHLLLHGDLHHSNVLSSHREGWLAIDPDAVIGERAHETAAMMRNPWLKLKKATNLTDILSRRIAILSEDLEIDLNRIREWGIAQNVLSAIWTIEDGGKDWMHPLNIAQTLLAIK